MSRFRSFEGLLGVSAHPGVACPSAVRRSFSRLACTIVAVMLAACEVRGSLLSSRDAGSAPPVDADTVDAEPFDADTFDADTFDGGPPEDDGGAPGPFDANGFELEPDGAPSTDAAFPPYDAR